MHQPQLEELITTLTAAPANTSMFLASRESLHLAARIAHHRTQALPATSTLQRWGCSTLANRALGVLGEAAIAAALTAHGHPVRANPAATQATPDLLIGDTVRIDAKTWGWKFKELHGWISVEKHHRALTTRDREHQPTHYATAQARFDINYRTAAVLSPDTGREEWDTDALAALINQCTTDGTRTIPITLTGIFPVHLLDTAPITLTAYNAPSLATPLTYAQYATSAGVRARISELTRQRSTGGRKYVANLHPNLAAAQEAAA